MGILYWKHADPFQSLFIPTVKTIKYLRTAVAFWHPVLLSELKLSVARIMLIVMKILTFNEILICMPHIFNSIRHTLDEHGSNNKQSPWRNKQWITILWISICCEKKKSNIIYISPDSMAINSFWTTIQLEVFEISEMFIFFTLFLYKAIVFQKAIIVYLLQN